LVIIAAALGVLAFLALRHSPYLQSIAWMPRPLGVWSDHHGVFRNTVAFFALGLLVFLLLGPNPWYLVTLCIFSTALEVAQRWIPGRFFDWKDIWASLAGIILAWPLAWVLRWAGTKWAR
jgi:glycopeptide antibiotics resistance protein